MKSFIITACSLITLTLLIVTGCQREVHETIIDPPPSKPIEYVTANVTGRITDDQSVPVQGAIVKAGSVSATTDINGFFRISNVQLDRNAGFVQVLKDGYFTGSRTILVHAGTTHHVTIQLIKKNISGTVSSSSGGIVTVANGGSIAFTPGSFIHAAGATAYTGTVSVSAFFLDPSAGGFSDFMPGTLRGIDTANEEKALQLYRRQLFGHPEGYREQQHYSPANLIFRIKRTQ